MNRTSEIKPQSKIVQKSDVLSTDIDDELVIMSLLTDKYYGLTEASMSIWHLFQEARTISSVCDELVKEYDVDRNRCEQDVLVFVQTLFDAQLIELVGEE